MQLEKDLEKDFPLPTISLVKISLTFVTIIRQKTPTKIKSDRSGQDTLYCNKWSIVLREVCCKSFVRIVLQGPKQVSIIPFAVRVSV